MFSRIDSSRGSQIGGIANDRPNLGGEDVKLGTKVPKRETTSLGQTILNFFKSIPAKISTLFETIAAKREENAKQNAATSIGKSLKSIKNELLSGNITKGTIDNLASMQKQAAKIDSNNPKGVLAELMTKAFSSLSSDELNTLASRNFSALGEQLSNLVDRRFNKYEALDSGLAQMFPGGDDDDKISDPNASSPRDIAKDDLKQQWAALRNAVAQTRFDRFEAVGKGVFHVDDHGFISGRSVNARVTGGNGVETSSDLLLRICGNISQRSQGDKVSMIGNARIADKAVADFPRMNIAFDRPNGEPVSTRVDGDYKPNPDEIGNAINHITGNNQNASVVLTSMLTQNGWTNLINDLAGSDGTSITILPVAKGYSHVISTPQGDINLDNPGQISEARFFVSNTDDGNLKIEVNWLASGGTVGLAREKVAPDTPHARNMDKSLSKTVNAFGINLTATLILSKAEADLGNLVYAAPPQIEHQIMGRVIGTL